MWRWGDSRLVHAAGWDHVFQDRSKDQDERHDGEDDPRGARAGHPRPHEDCASDEGSGGPNLHDRADHSDEDDNAHDDGSKDAHAAIIDRGLPALQRRAPTGRTACTHRSVARRSRCRIHSEPRSSLGRRLRAAPRVPRATQAYPRTTISPQEPHPDARRQLHVFSRIFPWKGQQ